MLILLFFLCSSPFSWSQDNIIRSQQKFPEQLESQTNVIKKMLPVLDNKNVSLKVRFFNQSNFSKHYTFDVLVNRFPVFTNFVKVNTDKQNNIISVANNLIDLQNLNQAFLNKEQKQWSLQKPNFSHWEDGERVKNTFLAIYEYNQVTELVQVQEAWDKTYDKTKLITLNGEVIGEWNHQRKFGIDTFVNANVFDPDPLTFLSKMYGSPYVDSNDIDIPWMAAAYLPVNIPAVYDTFVNKFFLESDYVKIDDIESPNNPPASSATNNFYFNRSQTGFEECMVAYHINVFHDHMSTLGYDTLMDLQLEADAHGQFGSDNSVFNRNGGAPTIIFGDGGIDDAEDADVIIHEYSHGVSWSANANTFFGSERPALDEGIADYFATSYSRNLSSFNWQKVFSWDGNNGNWQGRTATTSANYSSPFSGNLYALGEVWNAAMQTIYTDLGRNTTDELMLETLYFLTDNTTLPDAARYMIQADSIINGGANMISICHAFAAKSILAWNCYPTNISEVKTKNHSIRLSNSMSFSQGLGNAYFELDQNVKATLVVYDLNGRKMESISLKTNRLELAPQQFAPGIYIVQITTAKGISTFKLSRN